MADEPEPPAILAGDRDRDSSIELLSTAVAEGRLTLEEFSDRVGLAQAARTQSELIVLTRDLPAAVTPAADLVPATGDLLPAAARHRALFSQLVWRGPWDLLPHSSFRCIFGTVMLDLTQARLSAADTELDIYNLFGTVTLVVPDEVQVIVTGGGAFASQVIETPPRPSAPGAPRLHISARGPGGTLRVRRCS
jgi:Domain of unknown function (DUF1707)/Cell wall-active antibiotics response 4TMS YvqF